MPVVVLILNAFWWAPALWLAARRPAQTQDELVWFDRKARPAHVFARTRASVGTPAELVALLEGELQRA